MLNETQSTMEKNKYGWNIEIELGEHTFSVLCAYSKEWGNYFVLPDYFIQVNNVDYNDYEGIAKQLSAPENCFADKYIDSKVTDGLKRKIDKMKNKQHLVAEYACEIAQEIYVQMTSDWVMNDDKDLNLTEQSRGRS